MGSGQRIIEPELMDDPALDCKAHLRGLSGLARLNLLSRSAGILWRPIARLARLIPDRPLRILDVATGSGDIPVRLWRRANRNGVSLDILGLDKSIRAVDFSRRRAEQSGVPIQFRQLDVVSDPFPGCYDIVMSSLFLHHLNFHRAEQLLRKMATTATSLVLVNDMERSESGLALAHVAARVFTRSPVVRIDAPRSARAAFMVGEARQLAKKAGLVRAQIIRRWPFRFLLSWRRSSIVYRRLRCQ